MTDDPIDRPDRADTSQNKQQGFFGSPFGRVVMGQLHGRLSVSGQEIREGQRHGGSPGGRWREHVDPSCDPYQRRHGARQAGRLQENGAPPGPGFWRPSRPCCIVGRN